MVLWIPLVPKKSLWYNGITQTEKIVNGMNLATVALGSVDFVTWYMLDLPVRSSGSLARKLPPSSWMFYLVLTVDQL